ncbi:MAG: hypothetical protein WC994_05145 [Brumimicrobium sp.]
MEGDKKIQGKSQSNNGVWVLIAIIGLLLAGVMGWMYSRANKALDECQTVNEQLHLEREAMNSALTGYIDGATNDLRSDLQIMLQTYDALIEKDASMADSLQIQKDSIASLLNELKDTRNRSYYEINQLKKRNERLREVMNHYLIEIDSLNTLNINLTHQLTEKSTALDQTTSERDELRKENEENAALLTKGAKLTAFNFNTQGLRYKSIGTGTKEINRAGRVELISSTFTIGENTIAKTGNKTIYLQIINPDGKVLFKRPTDVTQVAGGEILYSGKREINYLGQLTDMTIVYNLEGQEIESGNYTVKVYADGALIGKDTFTLK